MNFWDNLLRYPRFFISSMVGLFLVLITPLIKLAKEIPNKILFFSLFFLFLVGLFLTLNQMINPSY
jgi:hypothetical protein